MNDVDAANREWVDRRNALAFALAGLKAAQERGNPRAITYWHEQIRQAQEQEARAFTLARQLLTTY